MEKHEYYRRRAIHEQIKARKEPGKRKVLFWIVLILLIIVLWLVSTGQLNIGQIFG